MSHINSIGKDITHVRSASSAPSKYAQQETASTRHPDSVASAILVGLCHKQLVQQLASYLLATPWWDLKSMPIIRSASKQLEAVGLVFTSLKCSSHVLLLQCNQALCVKRSLQVRQAFQACLMPEFHELKVIIKP